MVYFSLKLTKFTSFLFKKKVSEILKTSTQVFCFYDASSDEVVPKPNQVAFEPFEQSFLASLGDFRISKKLVVDRLERTKLEIRTFGRLKSMK